MNVNPNASPAERKSVMSDIITEVVNDLDSSPSANVKAFMLHLAWHEGAKLTKRTQVGGGPGRSFFQFEPPLAKDAVAYAKQKGWLDKLATASGKTAAEIEAAGNALPSSGGNWGGNLIETLLTSNDLFGTYLARIALRKFPAAIPTGNAQHAEYWADHWKRVFGPPPDRDNKVAQFLANANEVDDVELATIPVQSVAPIFSPFPAKEAPLMHFLSTLARFRWPIAVASAAVLIATLPVCYKSPEDGLLEATFNSVVVPTAVFIWQVSTWLFTLTFLGALLGPYVRGTWNSRLGAYVNDLETSGRTADADRFRRRALHETKWLFLQILLISSLGVFAVLTAEVPVFSKDRAHDGARIRVDKSPDSAASIVSLYPFMRNCCCCPPEVPASTTKVAGQSKVEEQGQPTCPVRKKTIIHYTGSEAFLLALGACALIMLMEWFASYAAFLFWSGEPKN